MKRTIVFDLGLTKQFKITRKKHISSYEFFFITIWLIDSSFIEFIRKITAAHKPDEHHKWLSN